MNGLKIISPTYFKAYAKRSHLNISSALKSSIKKFSTKDFEHYLVASSVRSSNIEGNRMDVNSFYRNRHGIFRKKEVREIEHLVNAYKFASKNTLTQDNFLKAHSILSKTLVPPFYRGRYRNRGISVIDHRDVIVYEGIDWELVDEKMNELFDDISYLLEQEITYKEVFYYASMIHIWIAKIHPFRDGNGRSARLLEKWFLAYKLGNFTWSIKSENYYWNHREEYYKKIALGTSYPRLDWDKCVPFLFMLPKALLKNKP